MNKVLRIALPVWIIVASFAPVLKSEDLFKAYWGQVPRNVSRDWMKANTKGWETDLIFKAFFSSAVDVTEKIKPLMGYDVRITTSGGGGVSYNNTKQVQKLCIPSTLMNDLYMVGKILPGNDKILVITMTWGGVFGPQKATTTWLADLFKNHLLMDTVLDPIVGFQDTLVEWSHDIPKIL